MCEFDIRLSSVEEVKSFVQVATVQPFEVYVTTPVSYTHLIAPGVDRMVMLLAGEDSIREIIPFPMNKNAQDLMMGAPSEVEQKQLEDVHIQIKQ